MRPSKYLIKLQKTAINKVHRLKRLLNNISNLSSNNEIEICLTYVTIEALNTWSNFSRSFYLSCTLHPRTVNGNRVTTRIETGNFNEAIGEAISLYIGVVQLQTHRDYGIVERNLLGMNGLQ